MQHLLGGAARGGPPRRRGRRAYVPVELPGCAHAFHHRCISEWFGKKPTCPMCRGNVTKHLDPELSCRRISSCSAMTMMQIHIHIHTHPLCSIRQETRSRHLQASPERSCSNLHDAFMRTVRRCRTVLDFFVVTSVILQFVCADDKLVLARLWICQVLIVGATYFHVHAYCAEDKFRCFHDRFSGPDHCLKHRMSACTGVFGSCILQ